MALIHLLIQLYIWVFVLRAFASWMPPRTPGLWADVTRWMHRVTEPVLAPIRRVLPRPRFGMVQIDLSVIVAIIALDIINQFV
jgi:YggT family protein